MIGIQAAQALIDKMVDQATMECAEASYSGDTRRVREALLQGHCTGCRQVATSLVRQLSEYLGQSDRTVKAITSYEPMATSGALPGEPAEPYVGINLVVWVERKSAAFSALLETLETVLQASLRKAGCAEASPRCFALDVSLVSDREVQERRGVALMAEASQLRSVTVWTRTAGVDATLPARAATAWPPNLILPEVFDPELIPEGRLLEHATSIENIPQPERGALEHHLTELKVILLRRLVSDQLPYISIAKKWFKVRDLADIYWRKIGLGRIGGKAAGMMLAANILKEAGDDALRALFYVPDSFFLGSDVMYIFMAMNGLMYWRDQKYKPEEQIWHEYPQIKQDFEAGNFPPEILSELRDLLANLERVPLIVRSSSQLQDNPGTGFAGKYDSHFCPNQGTPEQNLQALTLAIARTYASTLKPEALLFRRQQGLQDYDERMAILIQPVQGNAYGRYWLPLGAGIAYSRNPHPRNPQTLAEHGYARLVWGLGMLAAAHASDGHPRLVALGQPALPPLEPTAVEPSHTQQQVELIDLRENAHKTLPVRDVLRPDYAGLRYLTSGEREAQQAWQRRAGTEDEVPRPAITFDELLRRSTFAADLWGLLRLLEEHYHTPVEIEFTLQIADPSAQPPQLRIALLQCRPQSIAQVGQE